MRRHCCSWIALAALAGCSVPAEQSPAPADNSRNALDWPGTYVGTLPCADCPGIRMRVELHADGTFSRSMTYLERDPQPPATTGTFSWDAAGSRITLALGNDDTQQFQVGENALLQLDRDGLPITGRFPEAYRLAKVIGDSRAENLRWELVELEGQTVTNAVGGEPVYFELEGEQARVTGNAPCNRFFGTYDLAAGNRLLFGSDMGATRRACDQLDRERDFLAMLARVDGYSLTGEVLELQRGGTPLARFRAGD